MIHWNDQEREAILVESRTMTAAKLEGGVVQIDFISRLKSVRGDVHLKGDPEHAGVQFRPGNEVVRKQTRYLFHREGIDPKKDLDLPWVCESFELPFGKFAVVHLNHPKNPKGTRYSAYRDYGRFGALDFRIKQGETLSLRYRFLVFKESPTREQIQAAYIDLLTVIKWLFRLGRVGLVKRTRQGVRLSIALLLLPASAIL